MPVLIVKDLKKGYRAPDGSRSEVIDVPEFSMAAAEQAALEGGSGTGKTTFLNLIAGILNPDSGSVNLAGSNISALNESLRDRARAENIGYIFQTFNLLQGLTALENVVLGMAFGRGEDRAHARELLVRVGLEARLDHRPSQLSVGQQQRIAVARALANRPKLVLADEPTGSLDQRLAGETIDLIRRICRENGAALLLVSHDRDVLGRFDGVRRLADINKAGARPAEALR
jgi:putative ABC transport system ATP-binding protein